MDLCPEMQGKLGDNMVQAPTSDPDIETQAFASPFIRPTLPEDITVVRFDGVTGGLLPRPPQSSWVPRTN
ncbi:hypothetical protein PG988_002279 [Apiospora saccharicola]